MRVCWTFSFECSEKLREQKYTQVVQENVRLLLGKTHVSLRQWVSGRAPGNSCPIMLGPPCLFGAGWVLGPWPFCLLSCIPRPDFSSHRTSICPVPPFQFRCQRCVLLDTRHDLVFPQFSNLPPRWKLLNPSRTYHLQTVTASYTSRRACSVLFFDVTSEPPAQLRLVLHDKPFDRTPRAHN